MSNERDPLISEAESFLEELRQYGVPIKNLLENGELPGNWAVRYLAFVQRVKERYGETEPLPREIVAVIYNASVYCTKRYNDWRWLTGGINPETAITVDKIRWAGDLFIGRF